MPPRQPIRPPNCRPNHTIDPSRAARTSPTPVLLTTNRSTRRSHSLIPVMLISRANSDLSLSIRLPRKAACRRTLWPSKLASRSCQQVLTIAVPQRMTEASSPSCSRRTITTRTISFLSRRRSATSLPPGGKTCSGPRRNTQRTSCHRSIRCSRRLERIATTSTSP